MMRGSLFLTHLFTRARLRWEATHQPGSQPGSQRGDVPGWVLVTVMTAGLVAALYTIADDQLKSMLTSALNKVS